MKPLGLTFRLDDSLRWSRPERHAHRSGGQRLCIGLIGDLGIERIQRRDTERSTKPYDEVIVDSRVETERNISVRCLSDCTYRLTRASGPRFCPR